ncbi:MAG: hypothetical protein DSZ11_05105 [Sulfurovum sp.]|nr:MAG: hypothetical protein DSZ11_05105 [Sulfurovum sp.]
MKKILILIALLSLLLNAEGKIQLGKLSNVYLNYQKALSSAKEQQKNLFILFKKKRCPWCRKLKENTFQDDNLASLLNSDFVVVMLDKNRDKFPSQYDASRVPVVYMANSNEKVFVKKLGYDANPNEYIRLAEYLNP